MALRGWWDCDAQFGNTALIRAAGNSHADCVRLLLDAGADKEAIDNVSVDAISRVVTEIGPHTCIFFDCIVFKSFVPLDFWVRVLIRRMGGRR